MLLRESGVNKGDAGEIADIGLDDVLCGRYITSNT